MWLMLLQQGPWRQKGHGLYGLTFDYKCTCWEIAESNDTIGEVGRASYSAYQKNSFFANIGKSGIALWVIKIEK